jgi:hypothetical protein
MVFDAAPLGAMIRAYSSAMISVREKTRPALAARKYGAERDERWAVAAGLLQRLPNVGGRVRCAARVFQHRANCSQHEPVVVHHQDADWP